MLSTTARHSPTARGKKDVTERIRRLEAYERWRPPTRIDDFEAILGTEEWAAYWRAWEKINADLRDCQKVADDLRAKIEKALPRELRGAAVIPVDVRTPAVTDVGENDFPAFPLQGEPEDLSLT